VKSILLDLASRIIDKALEEGIEEVEFYGRWIHEIDAKISRSRLEAVKDTAKIEYGVLGAIDKRVGSVSSEDVGIDPGDLVRQLKSIIRASRRDENWSGFAKGYSRGESSPGYDKAIAEIEHYRVAEIASKVVEEAIDSAMRTGAEEAIVSEGRYSVAVGGVCIANSNGEELYDEYTLSTISLEVKSRREGEESSYWVWTGSRKLDIDEIIDESRRGGEYSVKFVKAKPVESGEYTVLLDPYMTALFISTVLEPAFSALEVQEKRSPLTGKLGKQVVSDAIDIIDDPTIEWGLGTRAFDDEGIATSKKKVVERGVLKTYLYNYYTARRENRHSTGNGFRSSPGSPTTPSSTNLVLRGYKNLASMEDMFVEVKRGIVVHGMIGYWMSNPVNGSTQATVSHGLYIENGEVKRPVKGVVIGGNIYEWLGKRLVAIGKELKKAGNIYAPALLINGVRVAG